jgi:hypothetical protein
MGREAIAMTPAELRAFLAAQRWVVLATIAADGTPVGEPVPSRLVDDHVRFALLHGSRSHDNITADPRVACAADVFPSYYEIQGATVHGRAEPVPGDGRLGPDWIEYQVPLDDVFSFDFRKIQRKY